MTAYYSYQFIKAKDFKNLGISFGVFAIAGIFALGSNATNLMATIRDYPKHVWFDDRVITNIFAFHEMKDQY